MFTPQQIEQISFSRATFGGYDMESVDQFLEPLLEDFTTLHKKNALLKSKMNFVKELKKLSTEFQKVILKMSQISKIKMKLLLN